MDPSPSPTPQRTVGRYALFDAIASGGMATVHYGRLLGPGGFSRTVAIKRLHDRHAGDREFVDMLLDEARLAARIHHPNVVPTLDVIEDDGAPLVVMEYVQGESLARLLLAVEAAGSTVPPRVAVAIVIGVLHGLQAAHEATSEQGQPLGIVHRDVSPQNIMVGSDGQPRLLDFGVAKAAGRLQTTRQGGLKGKLSYMAPEQLGDGAVDARTDLFAASVVLWETLTARRLFASDNEGAVVAKVLAGDVAPPSRVAAERGVASPGDCAAIASLDDIVLRGLAPRPGDRFGSCREMAEAIEARVAPAGVAEVAAWVQAVAHEALASRSRRVAEIEGHGAQSQPTLFRAAATDEDARTLVRTLPAHGAPPPPRRRGRLLALGILAVALTVGVVGVVLLRASASAVSPALPSGSASAAPTAITLLDLPLPTGASPEALAVYQDGLRAHRDGLNSAFELFRQAAKLDPTFSTAHLRVVMAMFGSKGLDDQILRLEAYRGVLGARENLSPRDRAIADALEPVLLRKPTDWAATEGALRALIASRPTDAELVAFSGQVYRAEEKPAEADAALDRALALDPGFVPAWTERIATRREIGDVAAATDLSRKCLAASPRATLCLEALIEMATVSGDCPGVEEMAQRYILTSPDDVQGYHALLDAELARGEPEAAVEATEELALAHMRPVKRARGEIGLPRIRAELRGDFVRARDLVGQQMALALTTGNVPDQLVSLTCSAELELEAGDTPAAGRAAKTYVDRAAAQSPPDYFNDEVLFRDRTPWSLAVARQAGLIPPDVARDRRDAWVREREARVNQPTLASVWVNGYARASLTRRDAEEALAHAPSLPDLARLLVGNRLESEAIGRTLLLAGKAADALPYLQNAAGQCAMRFFPMTVPRASLLLGLAREATGDAGGACEAYHAVLARWGKAKKRSVSADEARAHAKKLACGL